MPSTGAPWSPLVTSHSFVRPLQVAELDSLNLTKQSIWFPGLDSWFVKRETTPDGEEKPSLVDYLLRLKAADSNHDEWFGRVLHMETKTTEIIDKRVTDVEDQLKSDMAVLTKRMEKMQTKLIGALGKARTGGGSGGDSSDGDTSDSDDDGSDDDDDDDDDDLPSVLSSTEGSGEE